MTMASFGTNHLHIFLVAVVCVSELNCFRQQLFEGDSCENSDSSGVCTIVNNCPLALDSIRETGATGLVRCGFKKDTEIVCCPQGGVHREKPSTNNDDKAAVRGPHVSKKSKEYCQSYSKNLQIIINYQILGGENAAEKEFPHMAALGFFNAQDRVYKFNCGGTLISHRHIITAAHCIVNSQKDELKIVRLGVIDLPEQVEQPDFKIDYEVDSVDVHRKYKWKEKFNDIALVKLKKNTTFDDYIRPACLYTENDDPTLMQIIGWGTLSLSGEKSKILQKAILSPVPLKQCNNTYTAKTTRTLTMSQICAASNSSDACQGDSGGPLQVATNTSLMAIVGITSYGIGCGSKYPGVYTRIHSYIPWIEENVWP